MSENFEKELNLQKIFIDFAILLNERFSQIGKSSDSISEDTIRYLFFHACTQNGIKPNEIDLEKKGLFNDEKISKTSKLDLYIKSEKIQNLAIEFKYHKKEGSSYVQPYYTGLLLYDFFRLQNITDKNVRKLSIYVASSDMKKKLNEKSEKWEFLKMMDIPMGEENSIKLPDGEEQDSDYKNLLIRSRGSTNIKDFGEIADIASIKKKHGFDSATVKCLFTTRNNGKEELAGGNALRIFEIL